MCGTCKDAPPKILTAVNPTYLTDTILFSQYAVFVDTTAGNFTLDLPPTPSEGEEHVIKNIGNGGNILTLDGNGNTIDDAASVFLADDEPIKVVYKSGEWYVTL